MNLTITDVRAVPGDSAFLIDVGKTYCNPIPLPDYPIGRDCLLTDTPFRCDYRETADPTVLWEDGRWYLYPSCGMAYWTEDFTTWHHQPMEPYDCGYAPTVVKHRGRFYLTASGHRCTCPTHRWGPFTNADGFSARTGRSMFATTACLRGGNPRRDARPVPIPRGGTF